MTHRILAFFTFICCSLAVSAQETSPQQIAETLASDPTFSNAIAGIKAVRGDGEEIFSWNGDKMLAPASNMKLISTGAALFTLGPEYRFSTRLAYDGKITDGILHGNLYIVGGGDPMTGSKDSIAVELTETFAQWEKALQRAGISKIEGHIIGDGRWMNGMGEDPTWQLGDLGTYYQAVPGWTSDTNAPPAQQEQAISFISTLPDSRLLRKSAEHTAWTEERRSWTAATVFLSTHVRCISRTS